MPPYEVLDKIVEGYIERELSIRQIVEETDIDPGIVGAMTRMIDLAQHKRDQAAPVLKVTPRTFGRGRPMPIAMRWEEVQSQHGDSEAARSCRKPDRRR